MQYEIKESKSKHAHFARYKVFKLVKWWFITIPVYVTEERTRESAQSFIDWRTINDEVKV